MPSSSLKFTYTTKNKTGNISDHGCIFKNETSRKKLKPTLLKYNWNHCVLYLDKWDYCTNSIPPSMCLMHLMMKHSLYGAVKSLTYNLVHGLMISRLCAMKIWKLVITNTHSKTLSCHESIWQVQHHANHVIFGCEATLWTTHVILCHKSAHGHNANHSCSQKDSFTTVV